MADEARSDSSTRLPWEALVSNDGIKITVLWDVDSLIISLQMFVHISQATWYHIQKKEMLKFAIVRSLIIMEYGKFHF
jgi:hypothetical protein